MSKTPTEIRSLARAHTESAIKTLAGIMNQSKAPAAARVAAAQALLDRGWGKAQQTITADVQTNYVVRLPHPCETLDEWERLHSAPQAAVVRAEPDQRNRSC